MQGLTFLPARERFLPVKLAMIRERALADPRLSAEERANLELAFRMIAARFHFEFHERLENFKTLYDPFDPDRDTRPLATPEADELANQRDRVAQAFEELLLKGNYVEMPLEQVKACIDYQSRTALAVESNLEDYALLRVFYRGVRAERRDWRTWWKPWKLMGETIHVLSRVAILIRLAARSEEHLRLKVFKNVVAEDLEMLLPHVRVRMRLTDHLKVGSSVAGGVATAVWKAFTAAILSPWLFLSVLTGCTLAAVKGVFSFLSNKTKYLQALTSNLYFQNLASNASAMAYLVDAAEAEECKELLLAYYLLYVERATDYTEEALDRRIEKWFQEQFSMDVDFEVRDALDKLAEKSLLVRRETPAGDVLKVYDLPSALRRLDEVWDGYYPYSAQSTTADDRVADATWPPYPAGVAAELLAPSSTHRLDPAEKPGSPAVRSTPVAAPTRGERREAV
jgi:hypothetical protein